MTSYDYARCRLSVFAREEAQAIVAYLRNKRDADPHMLDRDKIDAALNLYWLDRVVNAPVVESLTHHVEEEANFIAEMDPNAE